MAKKVKLTAEQIAARDKRRTAMKELARSIASMSEQDRQSLAANSPVIKLETGKQYSAYNTCLIISQKPDATVCGGFHQWLRQGRVPKGKGCGLTIKIPCGKKVTNEQGEEETVGVEYFAFGTVFDVSDTVEKAEKESA